MSQCAIAYYRVYLSGGRQITTSWTDCRRTGETAIGRQDVAFGAGLCRLPLWALHAAMFAGLADSTRKEAIAPPRRGHRGMSLGDFPRPFPRPYDPAIAEDSYSSSQRSLLASGRIHALHQPAPQLPVQFTNGELKPGTWWAKPEASRALDCRSRSILRPVTLQVT